jgi:ABC-type multidrug transport system ATPase subunit
MNFNAVENLRIFLNNKTQNKIDEFLKSVGLWEYRDVKVSKYSKGMLRKLSIIRALLTEPNILILDEPFDGIDVENKKFWIEFLRKWVKHGERAVLISSHILSEIEQMCSRTLLMSEGTIKCSLSEEEWKKNTSKKLKYNLKGDKKNIEFVKRKLSKYGCSFEQDGTVWTTELCDVENARMVDKIFEEEELEIIEKYYIHNDLESTYLELMRDDVTTYTL